MDYLFTFLLLLSAAFGAGVLNAIAGGGSFLTFPALVFAGIPPLMANATSAVAVSPGYLGSAFGFRQEIAGLPRKRIVREVVMVTFSGVLGAWLLLITPEKLFSGFIPWLLLFATLLFAAGPYLLRAYSLKTPLGDNQSVECWRLLGLMVVATYGGYFNGGLGILLMALYAVCGEKNIHTTNALKNLNSLVLSVLATVIFAFAGFIAWTEALLMMGASALGGYVGARWSRHIPAVWIRGLVVLTGLGMSAVFFLRG